MARVRMGAGCRRRDGSHVAFVMYDGSGEDLAEGGREGHEHLAVYILTTPPYA